MMPSSSPSPAPLRHLVSPRRSSSSTSSISISSSTSESDSDDDSIGPLPLLQRNKSLVVRRAPPRTTTTTTTTGDDDAAAAKGPPQQSRRAPASEKGPDTSSFAYSSTSNTLIYRPPRRRRSIDTPPSHSFSPERCRLVAAANKCEREIHIDGEDDRLLHCAATAATTTTTHVLPSRPRRRTRSLQPTTSEQPECCQQVPNRRQPGDGANQLAFSSKRPDPPEQIRPGGNTAAVASESRPRKDALVIEFPSLSSPSRESLGDDGASRSRKMSFLDVPITRRPRRTASMPLFVGRPSATASSNPNNQHGDDRDGGGDRKVTAKSRRGGLLFTSARRSQSIAKTFSRGKGGCNDVWVEHMVLRDGKDPQIIFKSVYSKECKHEPPTGALNVIYMDELVKIQHLRRRTRRLSEHARDDVAATSPVVVQRRSFWGKPAGRKHKKSMDGEPSSASSSTRVVRTWKSIGLGVGSRNNKKGNHA